MCLMNNDLLVLFIILGLFMLLCIYVRYYLCKRCPAMVNVLTGKTLCNRLFIILYRVPVPRVFLCLRNKNIVILLCKSR